MSALIAKRANLQDQKYVINLLIGIVDAFLVAACWIVPETPVVQWDTSQHPKTVYVTWGNISKMLGDAVMPPLIPLQAHDFDKVKRWSGENIREWVIESFMQEPALRLAGAEVPVSHW
jgi:hypothetical protein